MVALNLKQRDVNALHDNFNKKPYPPLATWEEINFSQVVPSMTYQSKLPLMIIILILF